MSLCSSTFYIQLDRNSCTDWSVYTCTFNVTPHERCFCWFTMTLRTSTLTLTTHPSHGSWAESDIIPVTSNRLQGIASSHSYMALFFKWKVCFSYVIGNTLQLFVSLVGFDLASSGMRFDNLIDSTARSLVVTCWTRDRVGQRIMGRLVCGRRGGTLNFRSTQCK